MHIGISVVIPNYNGSKLLPEILPSVHNALEFIQLPFEILIADDCSTDDSIQFIQQYYPLIQIVSNSQNSGFAITANLGINAARYDLVLLMNSDVKLEVEYFKHLLPYFEKADVFGVMGRIIGWQDNHIQDGAKYPAFHNAKIKTSTNYLLENEEEMKDGLLTIYLSGANALLDRKKFLFLGGFNEMFSPFYVEDYELSLRAWRYGWKCYYEHSAICRHKTSTSIHSKNKRFFIKMIYNRNKWYLHAIHLEPVKRMMWMLQLIFEIIAQTLFMKFYYIKAFSLFVANYNQVRKARADFQEKKEKLLSVQAVAQLIWSSIENKKIKFF